MTGFPTFVSNVASSAGWRVQLLLAPNAKADDRREFASAIEQVWSLCKHGGFAGVGNPTHVSLAVVATDGADGSLQWDIQSPGIDPRFVQILRNVCVAGALMFHPVTQLSVHALDASGGEINAPLRQLPPLLGTRASAGASYPEPYSTPRFVVNWRTSSSKALTRFQVVFRRRLEASEFSRALAALNAWAQVGFGGFAETEKDLASGDCATLDPVVEPSDDYAIEMSMARFGGGRPARNVLLNVLWWIDGNVAPIDRVEE